jgi:uncharacterized coiled-coil DUF342 family protein
MKNQIFKIGALYYTFAQNAEQLTMFLDDQVQVVKTADLLSKFEAGDKKTVELFKTWVEEKSSILQQIDEEKGKEIDLFENLNETIAKLEAENKELKATKPSKDPKIKDLQDQILALEKEKADLLAEVEVLKTPAPKEEGGQS